MSQLKTARLFLLMALVSSGTQAEQLVFKSDFSNDPAGKPPARPEGAGSAGWQIAGNIVVATGPDGNHYLQAQRTSGSTGANALLSQEAQKAIRGRRLLVRFQVCKHSSDSGPAAVASFNGAVGNDSRTFQVQFQPDGSIARVSGSDFLDVPAISFACDAWQRVTILADFKLHTFDVDIEGKVVRGLPFVTPQDTVQQVFFGPNGDHVQVFFDDITMVVDPTPETLAATAPRHALPKASAGVPAAGGRVFDVGSKTQLFIDKVLVRRSDRVWWTQHMGRKHPDNPLLKVDQPWEGWRNYVYGDVIYDEQEKLFKMWYITVGDYQHGMDYFDDLAVTCYATSPDGIRWTKPLVGTLPSKNGKPHNAIGYFHMVSVNKDISEPDAQRRYKMVGWSNKPQGYFGFVSPDGLTWTRVGSKPVSPGGDVITGFWDTYRRQWVAFPKIGTRIRGFDRRVFYTITSPDFITWSEPVLSWTVDERDDAGTLARIEQVRPILDRRDNPSLMRTEYYGIGAYPHESCVIGFPWVFSINNNARYGNQEGPQEIQLGVSRDCVTWERPFRLPIIEIGKLNQWDASYHTTASKAIRVGDEIRLYYGGANYTHGSPCLYKASDPATGQDFGRRTRFTASVGLVTWKLDRFVSVDGPPDGGSLTTVPLRFCGDRLEINARTEAAGQVTVELLDAAERPIEGVSASEPFRGDELCHVVRFPGGNTLGKLVGRPTMLRFHLKDAQLFGFAFRQGHRG